MQIIEGGVTAAKGFKAAGMAAGIKYKNGKKDMAMVVSDKPCVTAGTFTLNRVFAAPVKWDKNIVYNEDYAQAIVVNSGVANACTGVEGDEACALEAKTAGEALGIPADAVLLGSTGVIGMQLPMDRMCAGIKALPELLDYTKEAGTLAAEAIMTTDTVKKQWAVETVLDGKKVTIGGIAKGSGMIHINMGTTLSFVTTDAAISSEMLKSALIEAADVSYNMVSVDGDTSTNDTLAIMASGYAGNKEITEKNDDYKTFTAVLTDAFKKVAKKLAKDGEGATKLLICKVDGAKDDKSAKIISKSIICSSLVKAAMFGADANCGRILCAIGYSGAETDVKRIDVSYKSAKGEILVCKDGNGLVFDEDKAKEILLEDEIEILVKLGDGNASAEAYGCDLTYDYVKINGDYRT